MNINIMHNTNCNCKNKRIDNLRKCLRYIKQHPVFIISLYFFQYFACITFIKYIAKWCNYPIGIIFLIYALFPTFIIVTPFIYIRVKHQSKRKTEWLAYIPIMISVLASSIAYFISWEVFFLSFAATLIATYLVYILWRWARKDTKSLKYLPALGSIIFTSIASWHAAQCFYILYSDSFFLHGVANTIWWIFVSTSSNEIVHFMEQQSWFSIGVTLIMGCMLIISWAKDKPSERWNPFSASELAYANIEVFVNLGIMIFFLYYYIFGVFRFSFMIFILLLSSNVATLIYCYYMKSDNYIMSQVIRYLRMPDIRYFSYCRQPVFMVSTDVDEEVVCLYVDFIRKMQTIASTVIRHMTEYDCNNQIDCMWNLLRRIGKKIKKVEEVDNIGFLVGIGCVPAEIGDEVRIDDVITYCSGLFMRFKHVFYCPDKNETNCPILRLYHHRFKIVEDIPSDYYKYIILGMRVGVLALDRMIRSSSRKVPTKSKQAFQECISQFLLFIQSNTDLSEMYNQLDVTSLFNQIKELNAYNGISMNCSQLVKLISAAYYGSSCFLQKSEKVKSQTHTRDSK